MTTTTTTPKPKAKRKARPPKAPKAPKAPRAPRAPKAPPQTAPKQTPGELVYCRVPADSLAQLDALSAKIGREFGGGPNRSLAMRYALTRGLSALAKEGKR